MNNQFHNRQVRDRFEVDFPVAVSFDGINQLVHTVEQSIEYQKTTQVEISLNSPGGEYSALVHFVWYLQNWRQRGVAVHTRGMVQVASAATLMLSLGDLGHRRVYPHTELVYHFARLGKVSHVTASLARYLEENLDEVDNKMLDQLVEHIMPLVKGGQFPRQDMQIHKTRFKAKACPSEKEARTKIRNDLERLFHLDRPISAEQAYQFYLVDEIMQANKGEAL